jgi:flagellar hook-basal body complex protein FliE
MAIPGIGTPSSLPSITPGGSPGASAAGAAGAEGFASALEAVLSSVEGSAVEANVAVADMVAGTGDVHTAMLALQRAEVAMQLTVQVRNKLVQAYQDLMRMPI